LSVNIIIHANMHINIIIFLTQSISLAPYLKPSWDNFFFINFFCILQKRRRRHSSISYGYYFKNIYT